MSRLPKPSPLDDFGDKLIRWAEITELAAEIRGAILLGAGHHDRVALVRAGLRDFRRMREQRTSRQGGSPRG